MSREKEFWISVIFRHFTTILIVLGAFWWLATPRVEAYVMRVVNERITKIEQRLDEQHSTLNQILRAVKDSDNER